MLELFTYYASRKYEGGYFRKINSDIFAWRRKKNGGDRLCFCLLNVFVTVERDALWLLGIYYYESGTEEKKKRKATIENSNRQTIPFLEGICLFFFYDQLDWETTVRKTNGRRNWSRSNAEKEKDETVRNNEEEKECKQARFILEELP